MCPDGTPITYHRIPDICKGAMPTITEQVVKRMKELGWTKADGEPNISELARRAGLGYATAHEVISGKSEPAIPTLRALSKTLRVPVGWLLGEDEELDVRSFEQGRDFVVAAVGKALEEALAATPSISVEDDSATRVSIASDESAPEKTKAGRKKRKG